MHHHLEGKKGNICSLSHQVAETHGHPSTDATCWGSHPSMPAGQKEPWNAQGNEQERGGCKKAQETHPGDLPLTSSIHAGSPQVTPPAANLLWNISAMVWVFVVV